MNQPNPFANLPPVSEASLAEFDRAAPQAQARVEQLCLNQDRPEQAMGPEAAAMIRSGMKFVSEMLRSAMAFSAGEILHDELEWGRARLPAYGVAREMVLRNLERYRDALQHTLSPEAFAEVRPYLDAMTDRQREITEKQSPKVQNHE